MCTIFTDIAELDQQILQQLSLKDLLQVAQVNHSAHAFICNDKFWQTKLCFEFSWYQHSLKPKEMSCIKFYKLCIQKDPAFMSKLCKQALFQNHLQALKWLFENNYVLSSKVLYNYVHSSKRSAQTLKWLQTYATKMQVEATPILGSLYRIRYSGLIVQVTQDVFKCIGYAPDPDCPAHIFDLTENLTLLCDVYNISY